MNVRLNRQPVALVAALTLAESCVLAPLLTPIRFDFISQQQNTAFYLAFGLTVLALGAIALSRLWLGRDEQTTALLRVVMCGIASVIGLAIFVLFERPFQVPGFRGLSALIMPLFGAATLLWRGNVIGSLDASPSALRRRMQLSVMALMMVTFVVLAMPGVNFVATILVFFAAWLLALPLGALQHSAESKYGRAVQTTARWWLTHAAVLSACLFMAIIVISLATGESISTLVFGLILVLMLPAIFVLWLIPESFFEWLRTLVSGRARELQEQSERSGLQQWLAELMRNSNTPATADFNTAIFVIFLAIALLLIVLSLRSKQTRERERVRDADDFSSALHTPESSASAAIRNSLAGLRRWLATLTIRRLYLRAERAAAKRGFKRLPAQTPHDFLPNLQAAFPDAAQEAAALTDAYERAHYGEVPDSPEALARLNQLWQRMRATV